MKNLFYKIIVFIVILPFLVIFLYSVVIRFKNNSILPEKVSFDRYFVLLQFNYFKLMLTSIFISLLSSILSIIISLPAAYSLVYYDLKFKKTFFIILLLPILMPQYSYFMGMLKFFVRIGINDTLFAVIISHIIMIIPYNIIMFKDDFNYIGNKYNEVSIMFEENIIHRFISIIIPLMKNTIYNAFFIGFTISFSQYFITLLVGGGRIKTYTMYVLPLINGNNRSLSATASLYFVLVNIFILIMIKILNKKIYKYD